MEIKLQVLQTAEPTIFGLSEASKSYSCHLASHPDFLIRLGPLIQCVVVMFHVNHPKIGRALHLERRKAVKQCCQIIQYQIAAVPGRFTVISYHLPRTWCLRET